MSTVEARLAQAIEADDYMHVEDILRSDLRLMNATIPPDTKPLLLALEKKANNTITVLLKLGVSGMIALNFAVQKNRLDLVKQCIESRFSNIQDLNVYECFSPGREAIRDYVLSRGADINKVWNFGRGDIYTPLHWTIMLGNRPAILKLLSFGADPNIKSPTTNNGPLHDAIENGDVALVKQLLMNGARINLPDRFRRSALKLAQDKRNATLVSLFTELESIDNNIGDLKADLAAASSDDERVRIQRSINDVQQYRIEVIQGSHKGGGRHRQRSTRRRRQRRRVSRR